MGSSVTPRRARTEGVQWAGGERVRGEKDKCHDDDDGGAEAEAVATTGLRKYNKTASFILLFRSGEYRRWPLCTGFR